MIKINLVPEVQEKKQKQSRLNYLTTVICASVLGGTLAVIIVISGLWVANNAMISATNKDIKEKEDALFEYKDLEETVLSLESGLNGVKSILDGKHSWVALLGHLEAATPQDVTFVDFSFANNSLKASLAGKNIDSLGRFEESYKNYAVMALSRKSNDSEKIEITVDGKVVKTATAQSDGSWKVSVPIDSEIDHVVSVLAGEVRTELPYSAKAMALKTEDSGITAEIKKIFGAITISEYQKDGEGVLFDASIGFLEGVTW